MLRVRVQQLPGEHDLHWSLDNEQAAVKAESCGDYDSKLCIGRRIEGRPSPAVASLVLDAHALEQEGFARNSINPFMFPGEGSKF